VVFKGLSEVTFVGLGRFTCCWPPDDSHYVFFLLSRSGEPGVRQEPDGGEREAPHLPQPSGDDGRRITDFYL
jgi:hypothetical protein